MNILTIWPTWPTTTNPLRRPPYATARYLSGETRLERVLECDLKLRQLYGVGTQPETRGFTTSGRQYVRDQAARNRGIVFREAHLLVSSGICRPHRSHYQYPTQHGGFAAM